MEETKTFGTSGIDLYNEQMKDVAGMRSSLLSFKKDDPEAATKALQNITVLRVYHQISRIIRYTELMDKIEDKMYESIEMSLDSMDSADPTTWMHLLSLQHKLQTSMIESHKLLEPYLDLSVLSTVQVPAADPNDSFAAMILDQESREKLRTSAQKALAILEQDLQGSATAKEEVVGDTDGV